MANALNIRLINEVSDIAQGDNVSTVVLELLDENKLIMPYLNDTTALINFIDSKGEIQYQYTTFVFDSRVEFNIDTVIAHGKYNVEVRVDVDQSSYVFPSSVDYFLRVNKSANDFYNVVINKDGVDIVVQEVFQRLEAETPGLLEHVDRKDNPHGVTKEQVGLGNVTDVEQAPKTGFDAHVGDIASHTSQAEKDVWNAKATPEDISDAIGGLDFTTTQDFGSHVGDSGNPHGVTAVQVGAETPAGAQAKADKALEDAKKYADSACGGGIGAIDISNALIITVDHVILSKKVEIVNGWLNFQLTVTINEDIPAHSSLVRIPYSGSANLEIDDSGTLMTLLGMEITASSEHLLKVFRASPIPQDNVSDIVTLATIEAGSTVSLNAVIPLKPVSS